MPIHVVLLPAFIEAYASVESVLYMSEEACFPRPVSKLLEHLCPPCYCHLQPVLVIALQETAKIILPSKSLFTYHVDIITSHRYGAFVALQP